MKKANILLFIAVVACSTVQKNTKNEQAPQIPLLIENGDFETESGWQVSAPTGYDVYAEIQRVTSVSHRGMMSGYVGMFRYPKQEGFEVLHGWTQALPFLPIGQTIRFGGWVRTTTDAKIEIEIETSEPHRGQTLFTEVLMAQPDGKKFVFCDGSVFIPPDAKGATFFAGISTPGEAWFDNLYAFVVQDSINVQYSNK